MLEEDKFQNTRQIEMEMLDNVTQEIKLDLGVVDLIMAIESGDIQEVKDILSNAKHSSDFSKEGLKILLLTEDVFGKSLLYIAFERGNSEIIKELLSYAKEIDDDDNLVLKQILLSERHGISALHVAAESGRGDVIKILLETAADLGTEFMEKLVIYVNKKGKNAIQLLFEHGHENVFPDSFKMLKDKYPNIWKIVKEMFDNVPLESRLYLAKEKFIMAVGSGVIKEVKDILSNAKNSSVSPTECLRSLLLAEDLKGNNTLWIACLRGNSEVIKELISYAKCIDDDKHTLKQLLFDEKSEESALHVAARWGRGDVIKLLLETTSNLEIEMLEKLIFAVDMKGKNAIQLMIEYGQEAVFADFFKMLEEDKYKSIRKKVMEIFDNESLESRLYLHKENLIIAIENYDIKKVKEILSNARNFSVLSDERLRILLLPDDSGGKNTFHIACERGNSEIIKELLSYAMDIDDGGATLKELLSNPYYRKVPFPKFKHRYTNQIKQIVESLISEARGNDRKDALNILEGINTQYTEVKSLSED